MKKTIEKARKKYNLTECADCKKISPKEELKYNSKFGAYNFKEICDRCADEIDAQMDAQQQDKY